jgi:hypothetical protein
VAGDDRVYGRSRVREKGADERVPSASGTMGARRRGWVWLTGGDGRSAGEGRA